MPTGTPLQAAGLNAYLARPDAPSGAGVLLLPAASGLGAFVKARADDLAAAGLTALAWDQFRGRDVAGLGLSELMPLLRGIRDDDALDEQRRLLDHLRGELGVRRVGVLGWCFGGRLALVLAAKRREIAACAAYHPSIREERGPNQTEDAFALAAEIACPVQWVHPGDDSVLTAATFDRLRDALLGRPSAATDLQVHPGAAHGFMERGGSEANERASTLAWPQTVAFLRAALGVGG